MERPQRYYFNFLSSYAFTTVNNGIMRKVSYFLSAYVIYSLNALIFGNIFRLLARKNINSIISVTY